MIRLKASERWTPEQCLKHPWFTQLPVSSDNFKHALSTMPNLFENN